MRDVPAAWEWVAAPSWRAIDFISDLHLSQDTPATFDAWRRYLLETPADAVVILGDLFEAWVGDDARHDGFDAQVVAVLAEAASRRPVAFMQGNRDFLAGIELLSACHVLPLPDPTVLDAFGGRWLLSHGDALCLADTAYLAFRDQVRSAAWQQAFLARPLAERRRLAQGLREDRSRARAAQGSPRWIDVDQGEATRWAAEADAPVLIHGHTHMPASEAFGPGLTRHVLSDWDLEASPPRADVLRLSAAGVRRLSPSEAQTPST